MSQGSPSPRKEQVKEFTKRLVINAVNNTSMINSYETNEIPNPAMLKLNTKILIARVMGILILIFALICFVAMFENLPLIFGLMTSVCIFLGFAFFNVSNKYELERNTLQPSGMITFVTSSGKSKTKINSFEDVVKMANAIDEAIKLNMHPYLEGGGSQLQMMVEPVDRMNYLKPIGSTPIQ